MTRVLSVTLATVLLCAGCGQTKKTIIVGSKNDTEQVLLGEIVAQHLEHRLDTTVERRLGLGGTEILYQAMLSGVVGIYPEYSGTIGTVILKEQPSSDPATALERARAEVLRVAQAELFGPLGFENPPALVVRSTDAPHSGTLSAAAEAKNGWKLGVTFDFQERIDGLRALNTYRLPMRAPVRSMDRKQLFPALEKGDVTMIAAAATDPALLSNDWKALTDDLQVFPPQQAVLLARQDVLNSDPRIRPALSELSGKITQEKMRALNAEVEVERKPPAIVAAAYLMSLGL
jgi:glycine betaine/choline ABC-type transport system substrate-binding protein